jgi:hypothetical protein
MSLSVMSCGFMVMTLKPNNNPQHWKSPASPRPKKAQQMRSQVKGMLLLFFFSHRGIVHYDFAPEGQTIKDFIWWF